jgi:biotin carboxyl carrier protein
LGSSPILIGADLEWNVQYDVEINRRTRQVAVIRDGDRFTVVIDSRTFHVDAARVDAYTLSLLIEPVVSGSSRTCGYEGRTCGYEVTVAPDTASSQLDVRVGSTPLLVGLNGVHGRRRPGGRDHAAHTSAGPQRVVAPMPGKIVRVLVRAGDAVTARQPLVVVEAMKMENELRAGRGGTVAEIHAQEGQSVEAGALLVIIQ